MGRWAGASPPRAPLPVIENDGAAAGRGSFVQGGTITAGGIVFLIAYSAGSNNDVSLDVVNPPVVYVDDDWAGTVQAADPASDPVGGLVYGYTAFSDMQSAISLVRPGGTIVIYGGSYLAPVDINKAVAAIDTQVNSFVPAQTVVNLNGVVTLSTDAVFTL